MVLSLLKAKDLMMALLLVFCVVSVLPLFRDPYFHRDRVDFWSWLTRELYEESHGEKE